MIKHGLSYFLNGYLILRFFEKPTSSPPGYLGHSPHTPGSFSMSYTKTLFQINSYESVYGLALLHTTYHTVETFKLLQQMYSMFITFVIRTGMISDSSPVTMVFIKSGSQFAESCMSWVYGYDPETKSSDIFLTMKIRQER